MRHPMTIVFAVVIAYAVVCLLAFVLQNRMVYFPVRPLVATPDLAGMSFEDVSLNTEDGAHLHGWFVPSGGEFTMIYLHGNGGNISHRVEAMRTFHDLGLSILIIDYRGYGRSEGHISERGTYTDAAAAWRYLVEDRGVAASSIIIYGRSLGSAIAIELASRFPPRALIIHSGFTSLVDVGARAYPWLPVRLLSRIRYPSAERIAGIACPKIFFHSREDDVVPYALGRRLFEMATEPKRFVDTDGDHNAGEVESGPSFRAALSEFLAGL